MSEPGDLYATAQELLVASAASLDTIPTFDATLSGAPDRQLIVFAQPVLDCCEELSVSVVQVQDAPLVGGLQAGRQVAAKLNHVFLAVSISRCYPVADNKGNPPSIAEVETATRQLDADGWALWNHLYCLWTSEELFTFCDEVFWDSLRPLGPQGGCAGWVLGIHMTLDGYCDVPSS
jgi:hypothetical protein